MRQQAVSRANVEQRLTSRVLSNKPQIFFHLLMNRRLKAMVVEIQIAAPTIKIFRIVVKSFGLRLCGYGRAHVIAIIAFQHLPARKVLAQVAERTIAQQALESILAVWSHSD